MFASHHAVFVGPGRLPDELREVVLRRAGTPVPDLAIQTPRVLALFDSAAEAEKVSSQLQRLRLGAAVAGPEQPPAESTWGLVTQVSTDERSMTATLSGGELVTLALDQLAAITVVDWRPDQGAADRGVLLRFQSHRPLFLRASTLDVVSRQSLPLEGLKTTNEVLETLADRAPSTVQIRSRKFKEAELRHDRLEGDLLPLAVAMVEAVDTTPGALPRPLRERAPSTSVPPSLSSGAVVAAWGLHGTSILAMLGSITLLAVAVMTLSVWPMLTGVLLGAWGTRRFMWARWLGHAAWGERSPIPSFPIAGDAAGLEPRLTEAWLDVLALSASAWSLVRSEGLPALASLGALVLMIAGTCFSAIAVLDSWRRR